jgi:hypothetical protein
MNLSTAFSFSIGENSIKSILCWNDSAGGSNSQPRE